MFGEGCAPSIMFPTGGAARLFPPAAHSPATSLPPKPPRESAARGGGRGGGLRLLIHYLRYCTGGSGAGRGRGGETREGRAHLRARKIYTRAGCFKEEWICGGRLVNSDLTKRRERDSLHPSARARTRAHQLNGRRSNLGCTST